MHGGAAGEGYWLGGDAKMQFELIPGIFDIKFNMPWIIDPLKMPWTWLQLLMYNELHSNTAWLCKGTDLKAISRWLWIAPMQTKFGRTPGACNPTSGTPSRLFLKATHTGGSADWPCAPTPCRANLHVQHAKRQS